jgi:hypothetical protein
MWNLEKGPKMGVSLNVVRPNVFEGQCWISFVWTEAPPRPAMGHLSFFRPSPLHAFATGQGARLWCVLKRTEKGPMPTVDQAAERPECMRFEQS